MAGVPVPAWEPAVTAGSVPFLAGRPHGWSGWSRSCHLPRAPHDPSLCSSARLQRPADVSCKRDLSAEPGHGRRPWVRDSRAWP